MLKRLATLAAAATLAFASQGAMAQNRDKVVLLLNWYTYSEHAPLYLGVARGYFAQENIDLDIQEGRGSGVTILALGGLLFTALRADGYRETFSIGLLTGSGSLGILLPPALPLILFGIAAEVPIERLFLGGILPGVLLVLLAALWGMRAGLTSGVERTPFRASSVLRAAWAAKFELALPILVLVLFTSGVATLLEVAALTALYALLEVLIRRELTPGKDVGRILRDCGALIGGVMIVLCAANGLSNYFVDAQIPGRLLAWVQGAIHSPWAFLLVLNLFLLVVGSFLDIFSATFVVVPLILPLGAAYGIDPVHLGIVTGISDEAFVTRYFRGLGYRSRGIGAEGLGRRIYIGPFASQGAVDQALRVAREAGFIAPYVAQYTRF